MFVCVGRRSVTTVSPTQATQPIKMPFGIGLGWAQGTIYYMGVHIPMREGAILMAKRAGP